MAEEELSLAKMQKLVHDALRAYQAGRPIHTFDALLVFQEEQKAMAEPGRDSRQVAANRILKQALDDLKRSDLHAGRLIDARFFEGLLQEDLAEDAGTSIHAFKRNQKKALSHLAEILLRREQRLRWERQQAAETKLPPRTYTQLFGVDADQQHIVQQLMAEEGPPLVVITGLGGIGKTALADAVARRLMAAFCYDKVIWLPYDPDAARALPPHERLAGLIAQLAPQICPLLPEDAAPAERQRQVRLALKALPCLVVVDNLETEQDFTALVGGLKDLAGRTKFLLTSRVAPSGETAVYYHRLSELSQPQATELLCGHVQQLGRADLVELLQTLAPDIYSAVGGNPLALKLVAGMTPELPLSDILAGLRQVHLEDVDRLYRRIFFNVWSTLDPACRTLLSVMPLAAEEGVTLEHLQAISGLESGAILQPVRTLLRRSLLENRGPAGAAPRYAIHRLTRSFILSDIIGWSEV